MGMLKRATGQKTVNKEFNREYLGRRMPSWNNSLAVSSRPGRRRGTWDRLSATRSHSSGRRSSTRPINLRLTSSISSSRAPATCQCRLTGAASPQCSSSHPSTRSPPSKAGPNTEPPNRTTSACLWGSRWVPRDPLEVHPRSSNNSDRRRMTPQTSTLWSPPTSPTPRASRLNCLPWMLWKGPIREAQDSSKALHLRYRPSHPLKWLNSWLRGWSHWPSQDTNKTINLARNEGTL